MTPILKATSFADLNAQLRRACQADLSRTIDGQAETILDRLLHERPSLRVLPAQPFACCVTAQATLTPYSQVIFETNRYSVPAQAATHLLRRTLTVRTFPFTVEIIADLGSGPQVLATHPRCYGVQQDICDPTHYLSLLQQRPGAFEHAKPIRQWRATWPAVYDELLAQLCAAKPDGSGVQEFIRILKLHIDHAAQDVEAAVKEALAHRRPSYDSVRLCLHHLAQPARPAPLDWAQQPHLGAKLNTLGWVGLQGTDLQRYDALLSSGISSEVQPEVQP